MTQQHHSYLYVTTTKCTNLPSVKLLVFKNVIDEKYVSRNEDNEPQQTAHRL